MISELLIYKGQRWKHNIKKQTTQLSIICVLVELLIKYPKLPSLNTMYNQNAFQCLKCIPQRCIYSHSNLMVFGWQCIEHQLPIIGTFWNTISLNTPFTRVPELLAITQLWHKVEDKRTAKVGVMTVFLQVCLRWIAMENWLWYGSVWPFTGSKLLFTSVKTARATSYRRREETQLLHSTRKSATSWPMETKKIENHCDPSEKDSCLNCRLGRESSNCCSVYL